MAHRNLSDFIGELEDDGELVRISAEVDPNFELAAVTTRACQSLDVAPALLFENVKGCSIPVVTNLLGSRTRICKALGVASLDEASARLESLIAPQAPQGLFETLRLLPQYAQLGALAPKEVSTGSCQQVVKLGSDVNLDTLPIPRCWPHESAPSITAGQVITCHPHAAHRDVDLIPLVVRDPTSLYVHWDSHSDGWKNFEQHRASHLQMPVAVVLGGDPLCTYAASFPAPYGNDETMLAGFIRNQNVDVVRCRSVEIEVPADAEIVIEGYIDVDRPRERTGPLAAATGFYGEVSELPVLQVTGLTHRSNPIFPAMITNSPPAEIEWLNRATERLLAPFVKLFLPEVVALHQPRYGAFRNLVFVSIDKRYPQQARKVMHALWSFSQLAVSKVIVVVDADVDVCDESQVWFHVGAHVHPGRDAVFCEGPTHMSDHAAPVMGVGHKLGLDATRKLPEEGHPRDWPERLSLNADLETLVTQRWDEYGLGGRT